MAKTLCTFSVDPEIKSQAFLIIKYNMNKNFSEFLEEKLKEVIQNAKKE